jgi:hypothetical protein
MEPVPPERMPGEYKLEGTAAHDAALDELIANASHVVRIFDRRLTGAFNSPHRFELMRTLLLANRRNRISIVLHDSANVERDCPRLMMLLKQFTHGFFIHRTLPDARRVYDPFAIADDARFVHRFHYDNPRGAASIGDLNATRFLLKRFDDIWQASVPAVTAYKAGL